jgi:RTX calcium-binding nonapeptide repeat (4 copies)
MTQLNFIKFIGDTPTDKRLSIAMPSFDSLAPDLLNNIVGNSNSLNTLNSLAANNPGASSSISGKLSSFVDSSGASSSINVTATSPMGSMTSSETADAAGATFSNASAVASASTLAPPTTSATAWAPAVPILDTTPAPKVTAPANNPAELTVTFDSNGGGYSLVSAPAAPILDTTPAPKVTAPANNPAELTVTYDSNGGGYWLGTSGSDVITCGSGFDRVFAGGGDDIVKGDGGDDTIDGGNGNDTLRGGRGQDRLIGGNGGDFLCGELGTDTLIGGSGADTFEFRRESASSATNPFLADRVVDFHAAEGDKIGLTGGVSARDIVLVAFDTDSNGTADASLVKFSSNNGDRILAVVLGTVNAAGATTLSNADFISLLA